MSEAGERINRKLSDYKVLICKIRSQFKTCGKDKKDTLLSA